MNTRQGASEGEDPTVETPESKPDAVSVPGEDAARGGSAGKWPKYALQYILDLLHHLREDFGNALVFLTLRLLAVEVTWRDVESKSLHPEEELAVLDFGPAKVSDTLLETAKDMFESSEARRAAVIDKTKTLLTLGSLFLALVAFLLPKDLAFGTNWQKALVAGTLLLFLHAIVLLLLFFAVGNQMSVDLDQSHIELEEDELKRTLAASLVRSRTSNDRRTDYLVEVFKAARFSIFAAFVLATALFLSSFVVPAPSEQMRIIRLLRGDPRLLDLLRGPKGEPGPPGAAGPRGEPGKDAKLDLDALAKQVSGRLPRNAGTPPTSGNVARGSAH